MSGYPRKLGTESVLLVGDRPAVEIDGPVALDPPYVPEEIIGHPSRRRFYLARTLKGDGEPGAPVESPSTTGNKRAHTYDVWTTPRHGSLPDPLQRQPNTPTSPSVARSPTISSLSPQRQQNRPPRHPNHPRTRTSKKHRSQSTGKLDEKHNYTSALPYYSHALFLRRR